MKMQASPIIGIVEWFRPGEYERVEKAIADIAALGVTEFRTGISWADWHTEHGREWLKWMIPRLAREAKLLPCFLYTPPSLGITPKTSSPPKIPKDYADFIDEMIRLFGEHFEWIELWNEPNNLREWDVTLDREWRIFSDMIGKAAYWARRQGKKTVLGGMSPIDPNWLRLMFERGLMDYIDAVGIHGFPGTFEYSWEGWSRNTGRIREVLEENSSQAEIWITEAGFSTWRHDERAQMVEFINAVEAPAERVYWYALHDLDEHLPTVDGFHSDDREYHFGLKRQDGAPKLLFRLWESEGIGAVREVAQLGVPAHISRNGKAPVLITGGSGFIGTNLASRLLESGRTVILYDNLSRPGVERNIRWLRENYGERVQLRIEDIRNPYALRDAVSQVDQVFHMAAQVAVTTSLISPIFDFDINIHGALNLLEAIRARKDPPPLIFTSTNKVYGGLDDVPLRKNGARYEPANQSTRANGVSEARHLDFHSPYGCSKGSADSYILDYARIYGLKTVIFRMSCIYGPHQMGTEDQGWVAHFLIRAVEDLPITLYGDGLQVRDILFVEDLVNAFLLAQSHMPAIAGQAFNIGGGPANTVSLVELIDLISDLHGCRPAIDYGEWRPGDQRYYVSDTRKFREATGWAPAVSVSEGVGRLYRWLLESHGHIPAEPGSHKGEKRHANRTIPASSSR